MYFLLGITGAIFAFYWFRPDKPSKDHIEAQQNRIRLLRQRGDIECEPYE